MNVKNVSAFIASNVVRFGTTVILGNAMSKLIPVGGNVIFKTVLSMSGGLLTMLAVDKVMPHVDTKILGTIEEISDFVDYKKNASAN